MRPSVKVKNRLKKDIESELDSLTENTALAYWTGIKQFFVFLKKRRLANNIRSAKIWLQIIQKTRSPATHNLRARALRFYFENKHADDPAKLWEIRSLTSRNASIMLTCHADNYLVKERVDYLVANMTKKMGLITEALFWSGCRISELLNIRPRDIKLAEVGKPVPITITGKGNKVRTIYLPNELVQKIRRVFRERRYLFMTGGGIRYTRTHVGKAMSRLGKKIGIRVHPHMLRHSKAMYLKDVQKLTPDQICKALGHADVSTTLRYYFHGTPGAEDQGM